MKMNFDILGPFEIPLDEDGKIASSNGPLEPFWQAADDAMPGLRQGHGCYVFCIRTSGGPSYLPWYVGKTEKGFAKECFQSHKWQHYEKAMAKYKRAKPFMFLIPSLTADGKLSRAKRPRTISFLEDYLIGLGISRNDELRNKKDTKYYREICVPGLLNGKAGRNGSRQALRAAMGL